jgi:peptidoglycan/LPS O-acetylase OafA/YrhL
MVDPRWVAVPNRSRDSSLARVFDPTSNALNALRLVLAILVVVSHSWPVTGTGEDPLLGGQDWGDWAVGGFFAISGYLITASRDVTPSFFVFLWKRALRIYPAFICALFAVAFVAAPLSTIMTGKSWQALDSAHYILRNAALLITQPGIGTTLSDSPIANSWNNPLWTLAYESACYVIVGLMFAAIPHRFRVGVVATALALCLLAIALTHGEVVSIPTVVLKGFHLGSYFAAGALLYLCREQVQVRRGLLITAMAALIAAIVFDVDQLVAPLPFAYVLMWAGARVPLRRIGSKNDISYGMYIYAFPIQQLLQLALPDGLSPPLFALVSVFLTIPLAWASYRLIEKPALRFKSVWSTNRKRPASENARA